MSNPFFKAMVGQPQQSGPRNFAPALLQHIQGFQGNPIEEVQAKLNSGEMSQEQYNQLYSAAQSIAKKMMGFLLRR